jgi:uncharacterized linocin/CFP29 family protein
VSHLLRAHAPISTDNWNQIDDEARERLTPGLAARRIVDFAGPLGWEYSATNLGRVDSISNDGTPGVSALARRVLPLVELKASFTISREELLAGDRGAVDLDFGDLDEAARRLVEAENSAVIHGWSSAGIDGIVPSSSHPVIDATSDLDLYPSVIARAVEWLQREGIGGPYALALSAADYTAVVETAEHGGYLLFDHLRKILGGPIVWAPGITGGVVVSMRGGDFLFESGQDLAVGYEHHDAHGVQLYLEETFSFRVATPEAAVPISPLGAVSV